MKKRNFVYFIGIGLLLFIPFIRVSVAAPPAWVKIYEDDVYIWEYNNHSVAAAGQWTADGVALSCLMVMGQWCGPWTEDMTGYGNTGNMTHEIDTIGDLGPDLEYASNYQSVEVIHLDNFIRTDRMGHRAGIFRKLRPANNTHVINAVYRPRT